MNVARLVPTFVLVLLCTAASVAAEEKRKCLKRFLPTNTDCDICKERTCYICLRQEPYVVLDDDVMANLSANRTIIFNCNESHKIRGLGGTAFDVMSMTAANSSVCVWGGRGCLFNDMVQFINKTAQKKETAAYRFAATGLLLENSARVGEQIYQSASVFGEVLVIFGLDG